MTPEKMTNAVHSIAQHSNGTCAPIVRIPSPSLEWTKWALDSGASGIVIPMVTSAAEMKQILSFAFYPPRGKRSFGPFQASLAIPMDKKGDTDTRADTSSYVATLAKGIAIIPQIEDVEGLKNVDEILSLDGVDAAFVGPFDLRASLGLQPSFDGTEDIFVDAIDKILASTKKYGKAVGTIVPAQKELLDKRIHIDKFDFLAIGTDMMTLVSSLQQQLQLARQVVTGSR